MMPYLYVAATLVFTVYGQVVIKWRMGAIGFAVDSSGLWPAIASYLKFLFDPFILSGFVSAFVASVFWVLAVSKLELSRAYPFMSLAPALVLVLGVALLGESPTPGKFVGLALVVAGVFVSARW